MWSVISAGERKWLCVCVKDKFKDSPVKVDEIVTTLLSLDGPGVTKKQVSLSALLLLLSHDEHT